MTSAAARCGPEVAVVIPTRNRARFVASAVACALDQRAIDLELIVVDDGSTDDTAAVLAAFDDRRLRVIRLDAQRGSLPRARNAGVAAASATWLAFLDDDDLWSPTKLQAQLAAAAEQQASFVYAGAIVVDDSGRFVALAPAPSPDLLLRQLLARNVIPAGSSNVLVRADALRRVGGFDELLPVLSDWDLWIRLVATCRAASCQDVLVAYVHHSGNMLLVERENLEGEFEHIAAKHAALSSALRVTLDRRAFDRLIAWENRRAGHRIKAARSYLGTAWRHASPGDLARAAAALAGERVFQAPRRGALDVPGLPSWLERVESPAREPCA